MKCVLSYCNILHYCNYYIRIYCSHVKPTAIHQASAASRLSMSPASAGTCGASWSLYPWTIKDCAQPLLNSFWSRFLTHDISLPSHESHEQGFAPCIPRSKVAKKRQWQTLHHLSVSRPGHLPFSLLYPQVLQAIHLVSWISDLLETFSDLADATSPGMLGAASLESSCFTSCAWHGICMWINHANAEASIHTRNTSIITQKGWWWCFSHEEGSSTSASARGSNYILIILRALVIS